MNQPSLFTSMDPETGSRVRTVDADWRRENDRWEIDRAIARVAAANHGRVDPNLVRAELTNEYGLTVNPRSLSARYAALSSAGVLAWDPTWPDAWTTLHDKSGNTGKPVRLRRYVGRAAA